MWEIDPMPRSVADLGGCAVSASDGAIGSVRDLYFDDERWAVRYLVVDTEGWLPGRGVLISPMAIDDIDWAEMRIYLSLTREQIERSPRIDVDAPVSREMEAQTLSYYGWPSYWTGPELWGQSYYPGVGPEGSLASADQALDQAVTDLSSQEVHLRSANVFCGCEALGTDGEIGTVRDLMADDHSWEIRWIMVDMRPWEPRDVLIPSRSITDVSWDDGIIYVELTREDARSSPAWQGNGPVTRGDERRLMAHYHQAQRAA